MPRPLTILTFAVALVAPLTVAAADCPDVGSAKGLLLQQLNVLKNRTEIPTKINPTITLAAMLELGEDYDRFSTSDAASVIGYVADVMVGGIETANCKAENPAGRDTHIELMLNPSDQHSMARHVIVEVTPRLRATMQAKGVDWSTDALRENYLGKKVKVTGWMLFDREHAHDPSNTARRDHIAWRATAWEIHPITAIELVK